MPGGVADAGLTVLATPAESSVNLWSLETGKQLAHIAIPLIPSKGPNDWNQIWIQAVRPDLGAVLISVVHNFGGTEKFSTLKMATEFYLVSTGASTNVKKLWAIEGPCVNGQAGICTGVGRFEPPHWIDSTPPIVHLLVQKYYAGHLDDVLYRGWVRAAFTFDGKKLFEDETVYDHDTIVKGSGKLDDTSPPEVHVVADAQSCVIKLREKQVSFLDGCVAEDDPAVSDDGKRALKNYGPVFKAWDVATGTLLTSLTPETTNDWSEKTWTESPAGRIVIHARSKGAETQLQIWDSTARKLLSVLTGPELTENYSLQTNGQRMLFKTNEKKGADYIVHTSLVDLDLGDAPSAPVVAAAPKIDVDEIPAAGKINPDAFAVVIGVEKYRSAGIPLVDYAARDAKTMAAYLGAMGFDPKNVAVLTDAQAGKVDFDKYFGKWLKNRVGPKSRVFIYYAGHGAPNPTTGAGYLMPYEADPSYLEETAYPVTQLYAELAKLPTKNVTVVLDACFSGQGERSLIAKGTRPLVAVQKTPGPENAAVIAAASGSQISASDHEARHGLLTYYLLAGLHGDADTNGDGKVTTAELFAYAGPAVERAAKLQNVEQTPTVTGLDSPAGTRVWLTTKKP